MSDLAPLEPEIYRFERTPDTPNNVLPVLVYRSAFSTATAIGEVRNVISTNKWHADGHVEANSTPIFHTKTHVLHAIIRGKCQLLVGGTQYGPPPGQMIYLSAGDIIVYPAGVSHCLVESQDYEFIAFYPEKSAKRDDCECRASASAMKTYLKNIDRVAVPKHDPVHGKEGPLVEIWKLSVIQDNIATSWW
ncbi:hypothetical protein MPH_00973 [Macrophomina phaseolina MS6]|uniref:Cupin RmlC-type n=1 Tax=Macrophomina phaseolina (strain MS6) TaxID=1126212 RepID=K2S405_MACPH|nr:hypothetical protein MPH_00973 [Macrophomina phaseolina MS6]